ncbi:MAG TPA: aminotransferase class V-fold PLP-dependent enzyme [Bacteroidales bacterium]|nr:aminotransferase class V-fold PLP-dependent enzyme [Bacteroidales bacterium]
MSRLESYFNVFRENIVGIDQTFQSPFGIQKIIYADWIASGRLYKPIEKRLMDKLGPFIGNPHTESDITAQVTTDLYMAAQKIIKKHVNANNDDILISSGYGMTSAINKFLRILGLRVTNHTYFKSNVDNKKRPVVFISSMEHHSNQISWLNTIAQVERIGFDKNYNIDLNDLENRLKQFKGRVLYGSFTAASNVTGIKTDVRKLAVLMHQYGGYCFIDYAGGAPYLPIDMHPENKDEHIDAIFFSPHKFLGGPGSSGILIFNKSLYRINAPDHPGGGTVLWTDPWGGFKFYDNIELREDGGTPGFLQTIKAAMAIKLKETMGCKNILEREHKLLSNAFSRFDKIPNIKILLGENRNRLAVISFNIENAHYNLVARLLNDLYGVQVRGGCACAGTYGHLLFNIDKKTSHRITAEIEKGNLREKPGFVRMSLHPTTTDSELKIIIDAIEDVAKNYKKYLKHYRYDEKTNEFFHINNQSHRESDFFSF